MDKTNEDALWLCDLVSVAPTGVAKATIDKWCDGHAGLLDELMRIGALRLEEEAYSLTTLGREFALRHRRKLDQMEDRRKKGRAS